MEPKYQQANHKREFIAMWLLAIMDLAEDENYTTWDKTAYRNWITAKLVLAKMGILTGYRSIMHRIRNTNGNGGLL